MSSDFDTKLSEYKNRQSEAKEGIISNLKGRKKFFSVIVPSVLLILLLAFIFVTVNNNERLYNEQRHTGLDYYENTKVWVTKDILQYFYINSKETWSKARTEMHVKEDNKELLFGVNYAEDKFGDFETIKIVDVSYTLKGVEDITYYYLLELIDTEKKTYTVNVLVDVKENAIYKIEGF